MNQQPAILVGPGAAIQITTLPDDVATVRISAIKFNDNADWKDRYDIDPSSSFVEYERVVWRPNSNRVSKVPNPAIFMAMVDNRKGRVKTPDVRATLATLIASNDKQISDIAQQVSTSLEANIRLYSGLACLHDALFKARQSKRPMGLDDVEQCLELIDETMARVEDIEAV